MTERRIVIVGGGPLSTYAVSHLAAVLPGAGTEVRFRLSVFDRGGRFGAGDVHSDRQARSSYLNRVAAQIAFAADESNQAATRLLPKRLRPAFPEWCKERFALTRDPDFDLQPHDVPRRYVHGVALRDMFHRYVDRLRSLPNVSVDLHQAEVTDVVRGGRQDPPFLVRTDDRQTPELTAHHILFVTGHSHNRLTERLEGDGGTRYVDDPYPLDQRITMKTAPTGAVIGVNGLGLTAIDVILHLSEGRGGHFIETGDGSTLRYVRSGREPAVIVAVSPSGVPVSGRATNQKIADPAALQHRAVFFTIAAIHRLRGCADVVRTDSRGRLDFSRHLLPLVVLEMAYVYYLTLLGPRFGDKVRTAVGERYQRFLAGEAPWSTPGIDFLLEPVQEAFARAASTVAAQRGSGPAARADLLDAFRQVLYGPVEAWPPPGTASPWGHPVDIHEHRFDWRQALEPVAAEPAPRGATWHERVALHLRRDVAFCAQGSVANPLKAACDGVWRDLRAEFAAAVDRGGLRPESQRTFLRRYLRYYNRLSNGPASCRCARSSRWWRRACLISRSAQPRRCCAAVTATSSSRARRPAWCAGSTP